MKTFKLWGIGDIVKDESGLPIDGTTSYDHIEALAGNDIDNHISIRRSVRNLLENERNIFDFLQEIIDDNLTEEGSGIFDNSLKNGFQSTDSDVVYVTDDATPKAFFRFKPGIAQVNGNIIVSRPQTFIAERELDKVFNLDTWHPVAEETKIYYDYITDGYHALIKKKNTSGILESFVFTKGGADLQDFSSVSASVVITANSGAQFEVKAIKGGSLDGSTGNGVTVQFSDSTTGGLSVTYNAGVIDIDFGGADSTATDISAAINLLANVESSVVSPGAITILDDLAITGTLTGGLDSSGYGSGVELMEAIQNHSTLGVTFKNNVSSLDSIHLEPVFELSIQAGLNFYAGIDSNGDFVVDESSQVYFPITSGVVDTDTQGTPVLTDERKIYNNLYIHRFEIPQVVKVGPNVTDDYETINEALEYLTTLSPRYQSGGLSAVIRLANNFVMAEQVLVNDVDLGWIRIEGTDGTVLNIEDITAGDQVVGLESQEVTQVRITDLPSGGSDINNSWFRIQTAAGAEHYFWYNFNATGTDPSLAGATGHEVSVPDPIPGGQGIREYIASETQTAINLVSGFTATVFGPDITITNDSPGAVIDVTSSGTGLLTEVITQGADIKYKVRIQATGHGLTNGQRIVIRDHVGTIEEFDYNGVWFVSDATANDFQLDISVDPVYFDAIRAGVTNSGQVVDPSPIVVQRDALTQQWEFFYYPAFGVARGTLPIIATEFTMDISGSNPYNSYKDGFCATDQGRINFLPFSGFSNAGGSNIYGTRGSIINANDAIANNAGRYGIWAYSNTHINARRARASNCGWAAIENGISHTDGYDSTGQSIGSGVVATRSSMINAAGVVAQNSTGPNIVAEHGGIVNIGSHNTNVIVGGSAVGEDFAAYGGGIITGIGPDRDWTKPGTGIQLLNKDFKVTVGPSAAADYATINEAIDFFSRFKTDYISEGRKAIIELEDDFVMREQVLINDIDLGWITIQSESESGIDITNILPGSQIVGLDSSQITDIDIEQYTVSTFNETGSFFIPDTMLSSLVDSNGNIYYGTRESEIKKFDNAGEELWQYVIQKYNSDFTPQTESCEIYSLDIDSEAVYAGYTQDGVDKITKINFSDKDIGTFVYTGDNSGVIRKFEKDYLSGAPLWTYSGHTDAINEISVDQFGYLYSSSNDNTIKKIDPLGNMLWSYDVGENVKNIEVDKHGYVTAVTQYNKLIKINYDGELSWWVDVVQGLGTTASPTDLVIDTGTYGGTLGPNKAKWTSALSGLGTYSPGDIIYLSGASVDPANVGYWLVDTFTSTGDIDATLLNGNDVVDQTSFSATVESDIYDITDMTIDSYGNSFVLFDTLETTGATVQVEKFDVSGVSSATLSEEWLDVNNFIPNKIVINSTDTVILSTVDNIATISKIRTTDINLSTTSTVDAIISGEIINDMSVSDTDDLFVVTTLQIRYYDDSLTFIGSTNFAGATESMPAIATDLNAQFLFVSDEDGELRRFPYVLDSSISVSDWTSTDHTGQIITTIATTPGLIGSGVYAAQKQQEWETFELTKRPDFLKVDSNGNIFTANHASNELIKIDPNGKVLWTNTQTASDQYIHYVYVDYADNIYITSSDGYIRKILQNGTSDPVWTTPYIKTGAIFKSVVVDTNDNLYAAYNNGTVKINAVDGTEIDEIDNGTVLNTKYHNSVALDSNDDVYYTSTTYDSSYNNVWNYISDGKIINQIYFDYHSISAATNSLDAQVYLATNQGFIVLDSTGTEVLRFRDGVECMAISRRGGDITVTYVAYADGLVYGYNVQNNFSVINGFPKDFSSYVASHGKITYISNYVSGHQFGFEDGTIMNTSTSLVISVEDLTFVHTGRINAIADQSTRYYATGTTGIDGHLFDGYIYTASSDNTVRRFTTYTSISLDWTYEGHTDEVLDVIYKNGFIYTSSKDGTVKKIEALAETPTVEWEIDFGSTVPLFITVGEYNPGSGTADHLIVALDDGRIERYTDLTATTPIKDATPLINLDVGQYGYYTDLSVSNEFAESGLSAVYYSTSLEESVVKFNVLTSTEIYKYVQDDKRITAFDLDDVGFSYVGVGVDFTTVRKINPSGNINWINYDYVYEGQLVDISLDEIGGFVYTATSNTTDNVAYSSTIRKLNTSDGTEVWFWSELPERITSIKAVEGDNGVLVGFDNTNTGDSTISNPTIYKIDSVGSSVPEWTYDGNLTTLDDRYADIDIDKYGYIYLAIEGASANGFVKIDPNAIGTADEELIVKSYDIGAGVTDAATVFVDPDLYIYLAMQDSENSLRKLDENGDTIWRVGNVHTDVITGIVTDRYNFVYTVSGDGAVRKFDPDGNLIYTNSSAHTASIVGLGIDRQEFIVTASEDKTIGKYRENGNEGTYIQKIVTDPVDLNYGSIYNDYIDHYYKNLSVNSNDNVVLFNLREIFIGDEDLTLSSTVLNGNYVEMYDRDDNHFYFWFNAFNQGTDPAIPEATGYEVAVPLEAEADAAAVLLQAVIDGVADFNAVSSFTTVTVTNVDKGVIQAATSTGLNLSVTTVSEGRPIRYRVQIHAPGHTLNVGDRIVIRDHLGIEEENDYNGFWYVYWVGGTNNEYFELDYAENSAAIYDAITAGFTATGEVVEPNPVIVDRSALTQVWEFFYYPAFGVARGVLPTIGTEFKMDTSGTNSYTSYKDGLCATDQGTINVLPFCGFTNAGGSNIYGTRVSVINANDAIANDAGRHGFWAYSNTIINARRGRANGCGWAATENGITYDSNGYDDGGKTVGSAFVSTRGSIINAEGSFASNSVGPNMVAEHGGIINIGSKDDDVTVGGSSVGIDFHATGGGVIFGTGVERDETTPGTGIQKTARNISVTVGPTDSDYTTINEALKYLSQFQTEYEKGGFTAKIILKPDFEMAEQVFVSDIDLGWITIESETGTPLQIEGFSQGSQIPGFKESEVSTITIEDFDDLDARRLNGQYIIIEDDLAAKYYFWFNAGNAAADPAPSDPDNTEVYLTNGVEVSINLEDKADQTVAALNAAIAGSDGSFATFTENQNVLSLSGTEYRIWNFGPDVNVYSGPADGENPAFTTIMIFDYKVRGENLNNNSIVIQDGDGQYHNFWFNANNGGINPNLEGYENIIDLTLSDLTADAIESLRQSIDNTYGLEVSVNLNTITVTNTVSGPVDPISSSGSYITTATINEGTGGAYKTQVISNGHGLTEGQRIIITDHRGVIEEVDYNGVWYVSGDNLTANTFELAYSHSYGGEPTVNSDAIFYPIKAGVSNTGEINVPITVPVRRDALTEVWEFFYYPAFGVARGTLPTINTLFQMDTSGTAEYNNYKDGLCATDKGNMNILPFAGFVNASGSNIYGTRSSVINANDAIANNAGRYGFWAYSTTVVNARRCKASNCGWIADEKGISFGTDGKDSTGQFVGAGIIATRGSIINASGVVAVNNLGANVVAEHGGIVNVGSHELGEMYEVNSPDSRTPNNFVSLDGGILTGIKHELDEKDPGALTSTFYTPTAYYKEGNVIPTIDNSPPVRQAILSAPTDENGTEDYLQKGEGLQVLTKGISKDSPMNITFGDGFKNGGQRNVGVELIDSLSWDNLPDEERNVSLLLKLDEETGTIKPEWSLSEPTYYHKYTPLIYDYSTLRYTKNDSIGTKGRKYLSTDAYEYDDNFATAEMATERNIASFNVDSMIFYTIGDYTYFEDDNAIIWGKDGHDYTAGSVGSDSHFNIFDDTENYQYRISCWYDAVPSTEYDPNWVAYEFKDGPKLITSITMWQPSTYSFYIPIVWDIQGTNDETRGLEEWTTISEYNEQPAESEPDYNFVHGARNVRVRAIQNPGYYKKYRIRIFETNAINNRLMLGRLYLNQINHNTMWYPADNSHRALVWDSTTEEWKKELCVEVGRCRTSNGIVQLIEQFGVQTSKTYPILVVNWADTYSVSRTAYDKAFQDLADYLHDGTWSSGVPAWISDEELGTTTSIIGSTMRARWADVYTARTALLRAISEAAEAAANAYADATFALPAHYPPQDKLAFYMPFKEDIPYPDDPAGTSHLWDDEPTTDGWKYSSGTTGTLSVVNGNLKGTDLTPSGSVEYKLLHGNVVSDGDYVLVRVRSDRPIHTVRYYTGSGYVNFPNVVKLSDGWTLAWGILPTVSSSLFLNVRIPQPVPTYIEYDHIYIGDGSYLSKTHDVAGGTEGTLHGGLVFVPEGPTGAALSIRNSTDYVSVTSPTITGEKTLVAWIYIPEENAPPTGNNFHICNFESYQNYGFRWRAMENNTRQMRVRQSYAGGYMEVDCAVDTPTDRWVHVAVVISSTATKWYIDGELVDTSEALTDNAPATGTGTIGHNPQSLRGNLGGFWLYSYALADSEIRTHYSAPGDITGLWPQYLAEVAQDAADAAVADADDANAAIADIADDDELVPVEKQAMRDRWDALYMERFNLTERFNLKTHYDNDDTILRYRFTSYDEHTILRSNQSSLFTVPKTGWYKITSFGMTNWNTIVTQIRLYIRDTNGNVTHHSSLYTNSDYRSAISADWTIFLTRGSQFWLDPDNDNQYEDSKYSRWTFRYLGTQ